MASTTQNNGEEEQYDRLKEVKHFDESKLGVKGLLDSGLTTIPPFFIQPPEILTGLNPRPESQPDSIPTIDLSGDHSEVVDLVAAAAREFGFFRVVNHGVPTALLDRLIGSIKGFHEQSTDEKARWYGRDSIHPVRFFSNVDLFQSKAASWRDTIHAKLGPSAPDPDEIPEICRDAWIEWNPQIERLGGHLMGLLCEGLGLSTDRLKQMKFAEGRVMVGHYYPYCPQPHLTVGIASHTDPGILTVLLHNQVGGLQIKRGDQWVNVEPLHGSLIINVGDIFQIMSNDEYKSVEHRVLANGSSDPRVSVAVFFNSTARDELFGPLPELVSPEKPAIYRQFNYNDYMRRFFTKELDGKSLINFYKL